jgi:TolA-binding protein
MKRVERHRLKENEVALSVERARQTFEQYQKPIIFGAVAVVVILAIVGGYFYWRSSTDNASRLLLAQAMAVAEAQVVPPSPPAPTPTAGTSPAANPPAPPPPGSFPTERAKLEAALPKFMAVVNAYPSTQAAIAGRYYAAATLVALGQPTEAIQQYRAVIDRAGNGLYGDMARLGLADAEAAAKQYDAAIAGYRELATRKDAQIPVDGVLMQLGRVYQAAGKQTEALQTFRRIVDEYPYSIYAQAAKKEVDSVQDSNG